MINFLSTNGCLSPLDTAEMLKFYNHDLPMLSSVPKKEKSIDYRMKLVQDKLVISLDLPGCSLEDVQVFTEDRYITIHAIRDGTQREVSFRVNDGYDLSLVEAHMNNGALRIGCPKRTELYKKTITVQQG